MQKGSRLTMTYNTKISKWLTIFIASDVILVIRDGLKVTQPKFLALYGGITGDGL